MRSEIGQIGDITNTMDCEGMNLELDEHQNNQQSASNQLFNFDTSGGPCHVFQSSYTESPPSTSSSLLANPEEGASRSEIDQDQAREQLTAETVVEAIFHSLDLLDKIGGSLNNFEDLLLMARRMYCKGASLNQADAEEVVAKWPKTWADAKKHLANFGYTDAKGILLVILSSLSHLRHAHVFKYRIWTERSCFIHFNLENLLLWIP